MSQPYRLIRTRRKSIAISIDDALQVVVRAPLWLQQAQIDCFVHQNAKWIETHLQQKKAYLAAHPPLTPQAEAQLRKAAQAILPGRVAWFAEKMQVQPTGVRITGAKKRFGSCNGKNSLCFSFYLMQFPQEAIDYVVVHELAHIRHHNHSKAFYAFVESILPDYREREKLLKQ